MSHKKYTIKDIAKLAEVSIGTVDRVLHKRGKVSDKAQKKVEAVLEEIDFHPNPIARNLKNNKVYRICVLMPDSKDDPYWIPSNQGIAEAYDEFKPFGVLVEQYFYHPYDSASFVHASQKAIASNPDALLMVPLFQEHAHRILDQCAKLNIVVALINNYIDAFKEEIFIGQDLYQSGRVAASLIHKVVGAKSKIGIVHVDLEPHMQLKQKGFTEYFSELQSNMAIEVQHYNTENSAALKKQIDDFLTQNINLAALFVTNSKAYKILEVLKERHSKIVIVGYDLLEKNIEYLKEGKIDFLIHQKPKRQAYLGVGYLAEHFLFGKKIPNKEFLPIDIITSENVDYYIAR